MSEIIIKLPEDIRLAIIPYTYKPQRNELLDDLNHYHSTKEMMTKNIQDIFAQTGAWGDFLAIKVFVKKWKSFTCAKRNDVVDGLQKIKSSRSVLQAGGLRYPSVWSIYHHLYK